MNKFTYIFMILKEFINNVQYVKIGGVAYKLFLRKYIKSKINDPDKLWDEYAMKALDEIFNCKEE